MTDGYSTHVQAIQLARVQASQTINGLCQSQQDTEALTTLMTAAVGDSPDNDPGRQALAHARYVHGAIDPMIEHLREAKARLDDYAALIR